MFSSAGIGELLLKNIGLNIIAANELIPRRAALYSKCYPESKMVVGDIRDEDVFLELLKETNKGIDFIIASPPCQGMSVAGKNRCNSSMQKDERNYLINSVIRMIHLTKPNYVIIENVPKLLQLFIFHNGVLLNIKEILKLEFSNEYIIESLIINSANYGVPQNRKRAIIKIFKKGLVWPWPDIEKKISVKEAIGHLPSLESGEKSDIKWHFARKHLEKHVLWMKNTPTGKSAFENEVYYPQKDDGTRIKGYESTYRRIEWNKPSPTITIRNDAISSQRNVHPGRLLEDGTYSDARVLSIRELMILNTIPLDWNIPDDTKDILIRQVIGESIPPLLVVKLMKEIGNEKN